MSLRISTQDVSLRSLASWLADREIWPTIAGVALATFAPHWAPWGLGLLVLLWLVRWLGRGSLSVRTPLDVPAVLLLLTVPITYWATTEIEVTAVVVGRLLAGLALAYGLANWARRPAHLSLAALGLAAVGLGLALYALISVARPSPDKVPFLPGDVFERAPGQVQDTVNANMMAGALVMVLPIPLSMLPLALPGTLPRTGGIVGPVVGWVLDKRWLRWAWFGLAALASAAVLVLTKSRGAWIAAGVAMVLFSARFRRGLLWSIPFTLLALGLVLWRAGPASFLDAVSPGNGFSATAGRVEIWSRAIYMIQDYPFTGIGAGTFARVADTLYPFFLLGPGAEVPQAHNLFLQVAVDLGLPGLVAYLAIVLLALWSAVDSARRYHEEGEEGLSALAWAGLASLAAMLVHGMVDATIWIQGRGAFVPWAAIGTILALHRHAVRERG